MDPGDAAGTRRVPYLLALIGAASSIAALLLHAIGLSRMPFTVSFVTVPGLTLLVGIMVWAKRRDQPVLRNRLIVGTVAGALGLVAYDAIRFGVQELLPFEFDAFATIRTFGSLMTGDPPETTLSVTLGWAYHVSNGWTFAVIYALLAGPARWWWGLAWGGLLEFGMMVVYPTLFNPRPISGFVTVSVIGHAAFGATVGVWCARHVTPGTEGLWRTLLPRSRRGGTG